MNFDSGELDDMPDGAEAKGTPVAQSRDHGSPWPGAFAVAGWAMTLTGGLTILFGTPVVWPAWVTHGAMISVLLGSLLVAGGESGGRY